MNTNTEHTLAQLADMPAEEVLKNFARFEHYQILGKCLGYNPEIKACGNEMPLQDWPYEDEDVECRRALDRWTRSKQAAEPIMSQLKSAATPLWGESRDYAQIVEEVADHLDMGTLTAKNVAGREETILRKILQDALVRIAKLPDAKKAKVEEELSAILTKSGTELGSMSATDYLKSAGMAGVGTLLGTQIATGIILSHLGIWHGLLFAAGLWSVPTLAVASGILAPLVAGLLVYQLGKHNFRKTIPCLAIIASIRREEMDRLQKQDSACY